MKEAESDAVDPPDPEDPIQLSRYVQEENARVVSRPPFISKASPKQSISLEQLENAVAEVFPFATDEQLIKFTQLMKPEAALDILRF